MLLLLLLLLPLLRGASGQVQNRSCIATNASKWLDPGNAYTEGYCSCLKECTQINDLDNMRVGYFLCGLLFGLWYVVSMLNLVHRLRERSQLAGGTQLPPPPPMVPSMLNTFNNKPFSTLLPAWICDNFSMAIVQVRRSEGRVRVHGTHRVHALRRSTCWWSSQKSY